MARISAVSGSATYFCCDRPPQLALMVRLPSASRLARKRGHPLRALFSVEKLWRSCFDGRPISRTDFRVHQDAHAASMVSGPLPLWGRMRIPVSLQKRPVKTRGALSLHPSSQDMSISATPSTDRRRLLYKAWRRGCGLLLPARLAAAQNAARSLKFYNIQYRGKFAGDLLGKWPLSAGQPASD
jgi:hypothetical protein